MRWRASRVLLSRGCLEFHHQFGRDAAAVFDLDALGFGPLADLGGVRPARRSPPPGPCWAAGSAIGPPPSAHILRKRLAERLGVFFVQVDLVLGAVQPETDGSLGGAAVKVIDEQGLDLLGHGRLIPLTDLRHTSVNNPTPDQRGAAPARSADTGMHPRTTRPEFTPGAGLGASGPEIARLIWFVIKWWPITQWLDSCIWCWADRY